MPRSDLAEPLSRLTLPMRFFALVTLVALVAMFAGCGSKGPLYLPKKEPAAQNRAAPAEPAAPDQATD